MITYIYIVHVTKTSSLSSVYRAFAIRSTQTHAATFRQNTGNEAADLSLCHRCLDQVVERKHCITLFIIALNISSHKEKEIEKSHEMLY